MISFSQQRGGAIKSIQRGVILLTGTNLSKTVTITPVNPAFAELRNLGTSGLIDNFGNVGVPHLGGMLTLSGGGTSIAGKTAGHTSSTNLEVSWELTEYYPT